MRVKVRCEFEIEIDNAITDAGLFRDAASLVGETYFEMTAAKNLVIYEMVKVNEK